MRIPRRLLIAAGVAPVVLLFALLAWGLSRSDSTPGGLSVFSSTGEARLTPRPAPDFTLELFNGRTFSLGEQRGDLVMVDFWASWCPPCRAEADALEAVWQEYQGRGVTFVGVDIWDREEEAREFIDLVGTSYPTGPDPRGALAVDFGVTGIPEKYFIDSEGNLVRKFVGPMTEERLSGILDDLLNA